MSKLWTNQTMGCKSMYLPMLEVDLEDLEEEMI